MIPELRGPRQLLHLSSRSLLCPLSVPSESRGSSDSDITSEEHCGDQPGLTWGIRSFLCSCDGKILGEIVILFQLCIQTNQVLHQKSCQVYDTDRQRGKNHNSQLFLTSWHIPVLCSCYRFSFVFTSRTFCSGWGSSRCSQVWVTPGLQLHFASQNSLYLD